jgi:hypothetical protein
MIAAVADKVRMLADADSITKAALYAGLGLMFTYEHDRRVVRIEARPTTLGTDERACRRGDLSAGATRFGSPERRRWRRSPYRSAVRSMSVWD